MFSIYRQNKISVEKNSEQLCQSLYNYRSHKKNVILKKLKNHENSSFKNRYCDQTKTK